MHRREDRDDGEPHEHEQRREPRERDDHIGERAPEVEARERGGPGEARGNRQRGRPDSREGGGGHDTHAVSARRRESGQQCLDVMRVAHEDEAVEVPARRGRRRGKEGHQPASFGPARSLERGRVQVPTGRRDVDADLAAGCALDETSAQRRLRGPDRLRKTGRVQIGVAGEREVVAATGDEKRELTVCENVERGERERDRDAGPALGVERGCDLPCLGRRGADDDRETTPPGRPALCGRRDTQQRALSGDGDRP